MAEVRVPKFGPSTVEVEVIEVFASSGQSITESDSIAEIESEKATMIVEAPVDGTVVEICVSVGDICEIGALICIIE